MNKTSCKIGITGINGFIGSNFSALLDRNNLDYSSFEGDLLNHNDIDSWFQEKQIDVVVHLAGLAGGEDLGILLKSNAITTANLLASGTKYGMKRIIFISTGAVYADSVLIHKESDPLIPNTEYGFSKKMAEDIIIFYNRIKNINYVILRFPSVYGNGNNKGVIYNFLKGIKDDGEIFISGDGEQVRDFLHVTDACSAILKAIEIERCVVLNVSSKVSYSLNQLVKVFQEKYNFKVRHNRSLIKNNLQHVKLDYSRASSILDYKPEVNELDLSQFEDENL